MKKLIYLFVLTLICFQAQAQTDTSDSVIIAPDAGEGDIVPEMVKPDVQVVEPEESIEPFIVAEEMPEFIGGEDSMRRFINNTLVYPQAAKENGIEGKVVIKFTVTETGEIINPMVINKNKLGHGCEEAALSVISKMPGWKPGKYRNKPVSVYFILPIVFRLH